MSVLNPLRSLSRLSTSTRIFSFIAAIALASVSLRIFALDGLSTPSDQFAVPWWALIIAFAAAEAFVVNLHFRSEAGSFSLLEVPLVVGLVFASPGQLWSATVIGAAIGLALIRRQPLVKVCFNVANLSLRVAIAVVIYRAFLGDNLSLEPAGWAALFPATALSALVEVGCIGVVISLSEGHFEVRRVRNMVVFGMLVSLGNTLQALIGMLVVSVDRRGVVLLAGSSVMLFIAYRAFLSEKDHRERVEFLYESTRSLHQSDEKDDAIGYLLDEAASMFRASRVELVLLAPPDTDVEVSRFSYEEGASSLRDMSPELSRFLPAALAACEESQLVVNDEVSKTVRRFLDEVGIDDALAGTLSTDDRSVGLLIVGDRLGSVATFTEDDLRLFEKLVEQSAVALENDQLEQALSRMRRLESELSHQAQFDQLTGLANRRQFGLRLDAVLDGHLLGNEARTASVLYVDLDDFKLVNDRFGHTVGDQVLIEVAERVRLLLDDRALAARLGGDEFAVVIEEHEDPEALAEAIIRRVSEPYFVNGEEARIGASVGLAMFDGATEAADVLQRADLAMYEAKRLGKGSVVLFGPDLESAKSQQLAVHTSLRRAIAEQAFEPVYQPIVRLSDLRIVGAEALVRWADGSRLIPPAEFLEEAERSGLIIAVDRIMRASVLEDVRELQDAAISPLWVSVNISARHLDKPTFVAELGEDLQASGADGASLVLEITESAFAGDALAVSSLLDEVRALGPKIALDDFGTGYSSLSYLRNLPVDILKIAREFVADLDSEAGYSFVQAITTLAHGLSMTVVAEGIEDAAALGPLRAIDCELGQGFHFGQPMTKAELCKLLAELADEHDGSLGEITQSRRRRSSDLATAPLKERT